MTNITLLYSEVNYFCKTKNNNYLMNRSSISLQSEKAEVELKFESSNFAYYNKLSILDFNILNSIITKFTLEQNFNLYELVQQTISPDYIFLSQNGEILESFYNIKDYLVSNGFLIEKKEMVAYSLTEKGIILRHFKTLSQYKDWEIHQPFYQSTN